MVIWVVELSASGKPTLCNSLKEMLKQHVPELVVLDGEACRAAFGVDLGHSEQDRIIQLGRFQATAKFLVGQELAVIVAAVYAPPEVLKWNRANLRGYFEVYLDASLETSSAGTIRGITPRLPQERSRALWEWISHGSHLRRRIWSWTKIMTRMPIP